MKRINATPDPVVDEAPDVDLSDFEVVSAGSQSKIGTLSFPVRGEPIYAPISDNTAMIIEVVEKRQPALLLCAGWTVPAERSLAPIIAVTRQVKTVVVVETALPIAVYFRIADGHAFRMGEQFFSTREESDDESLPRGLADALSKAIRKPDLPIRFRKEKGISQEWPRRGGMLCENHTDQI
jgi:hypothetical protein